MKKRTFSLILAALLAALPIVSCGDETGPGTNDDTTTDTGDVTTAPVVEELKSGVPEGTDLAETEISIWYTTVSSSVAETLVDLNPEITGETLDDATFNMNKAVEQKLNCTLNFYSATTPSGETGAEAQKLILADDSTYDVFHLVQWNSSRLAAEDIYYNMKDAPYLSLDEPWWNKAYMEELTIGDSVIYGLVGDYCVDRTRDLNCIYYNKNMYEDFYKDPDALYTEVIDGKWTIDLYRKICADVYNDVNNDSKIDREDTLGSSVNDYNNIDSFFYACGVRATERDKNGIPTITINNERTVNTVQALYELVFETQGMYFSGPQYAEDVLNRQKFEEGTQMFLPGFFYTSEAMREMKADFGIIPFPKLDEDQENYISDVHDIMRIMYLPANCRKVDEVCAVLEEMAFLGYRDVLPAYYEVLMKNKYVRDDISAEMLDIIRDNCRPDFAHIYGLNEIGYAGRRLVQAKSTNFASWYAEKESGAQVALEEMIELYTEE